MEHYQRRQYAVNFTTVELEQLRINYQTTEDIIAELNLMYKATGSKPKRDKTPSNVLDKVCKAIAIEETLL